ncbi:MAG: thiamine phosphate synthase [Eubacterium sp.]|nr:thiamine phosphate synthase [Eubacterium sp.]
MRFLREEMRLYAVTDRRWLGGRSLYDAVRDALDGGVTLVQLREKDLDPEAFRKEASEIRDLCASRGVHLLINDNVELACEINADGVHIGQDDMDAAEARKLLGPDKIIGVTAKTVEQARSAELAGADYLGVGAVFPTESKKDARRITIEQLNRITHAVSIPAVAIGGITAGNVAELKNTGIAGIAVVSALFAEPHIKDAARKLRKIADDL